MKESALWKKVKKALEEAGGKDLWLQRIESWSTPSIPDVLGIYKGHVFWIELKVAPVKFRPGQKIWLKKWWKARGRCFVLWENDGWINLLAGNLEPVGAWKNYKSSTLGKELLTRLATYDFHQIPVQD